MKGSHKDVNSRDRESLEEILELASYIIILMIKTLCFLLYLSSSPQDWTMTPLRQDYVFLYSFPFLAPARCSGSKEWAAWHFPAHDLLSQNPISMGMDGLFTITLSLGC